MLRNAGPKTKTRREVTRLAGFGIVTEFDRSDTPGYDWHFRDAAMRWHDISHARLMQCCPFGQAGDRLWVRESFAHIYRGNAAPASRRPDDVAYMADGLTPDASVYGSWKPSIHMPRWASRITLEITGLRVERLQDITEADAIAEGIEHNWSGDLSTGPNGYGSEGWKPECGWRHYLNSLDGDPAYTAGESFSTLWQSIYGASNWTANPWVWVMSFRRIKP